MAKITDPKDGTIFVSGQGQYGFQMCCVHNLGGLYTVLPEECREYDICRRLQCSDKLLTTAADIISFMSENHSLGAVVQKSARAELSQSLRDFSAGNKEEKTNYRYLDLQSWRTTICWIIPRLQSL